MQNGKFDTYKQKMTQANREAKATLVALAVIVVAWLAGGFGLANSGIELFSTPIWIFGGTIGTWVVAIICAVVLARFVFADFDLEDDAEDAPSEAATPAEEGARHE